MLRTRQRTALLCALVLVVAAAPASSQTSRSSNDQTVTALTNGWQPRHVLIVRDVISHFDMNADGGITPAEYAQGMGRQFQRWDITGNAILQTEELSAPVGEAMMSAADADGDGELSSAEYLSSLWKIGSAADLDDNRRITDGEIARIVNWGRLPAPGGPGAPGRTLQRR